MDSLPKGIGDGTRVIALYWFIVVSQVDSLPKGIGDIHISSVFQFVVSQVDSLPKGIGDRRLRFVGGFGFMSQVDSLPKGIGDQADDLLAVAEFSVPSGLVAERHW